MKKIFLALSLLIASYSVFGQGIMVAGKVGTSISTIKTNRANDFNYKPNINFGIAVEAATNDMFSLQAECMYSIISSKSEGTTINLNYVDFPILAKLTFGKKERFFFNAGPMVSILARAKEKGSVNILDGTLSPAENSGERDGMRYLNDSNFSMVFGVGALIDNIMIDFRYITGFSDISRAEGNDLSVSRFDITVAYALVF
ncbi:porin family protein [Flammeovirga sp. EKP202]|uniref:porin family protein n=1 Tax=Flammeovirga sp. EKP202 TaxID=2770592 RepID=UPI00165ED7A0|nr:porin family protein [Flammeovirga sp. EKP202]MBD0402154.1 PorT family protein [Flammeovirga sp. EKP202]